MSIIIGLLLIAAALCLTGYNFLEDHQASSASNEALQQLALLVPELAEAPEADVDDPLLTAEPINPAEIEYPDYVLNPDMEMPVAPISGLDYIGVLTIPSLTLNLPIIGTYSLDALKISPARYRGTPYKSNFVICAHNYYCHFRRLKNLDIGDKVYFTDVDDNVFSYRVLEVEILDPYDFEGMVETNYWDMTLFTCTIGGATRVTVRCVYDE